jgi:enterochelin esterase family protein
MRGLLLSLLMMLPASPIVAGGVVTLGLEAESSLLGRPIRYALYMPEAAPPATGWPVLYMLHGLTANDAMWFQGDALNRLLDEAIATGRMQPMIVVAPYVGDSWYVDSSPRYAFGPVDSALATDMIAAIDASLPTASCRSARAVAGISMGGAGAMLQAINHPELYTAAIGFSPALHQPVPAADVRPGMMADFYGGVFGEPFDPAMFNAANAFNRIDRLAAANDLPDIYLVIGDDDYPDLIESTALFHARLMDEGIDTTLRVLDGAHDWAFWSTVIIPALEWLSPKLDPSCG